MITLRFVYALAGAMFAIFAILGLRDVSNLRRWRTSAFWGLLAVSMLGGDKLGDFGNGILVLILVGIAGFGGLGRGGGGDARLADKQAHAKHFGNGLFLIALMIPATALTGTLLFKQYPALVDTKQATVISLAIGVLIALGAGYAWLKPAPILPLQQGRRLLDSVGWAAILPQMLASLGAVFALAGVGNVVGGLAGRAIPEGSLAGAVFAFGVGMAIGLHGTDETRRPPWSAYGGAEIHERLREVTGTLRWRQRGRQTRDVFLGAGQRLRECKQPRRHALYVAIDGRCLFIERNRSDGRSRVGPDAGQCAQARTRSWKLASVLTHDRLGAGM